MPAFMARTSNSYLSLELGARRAERGGAANLRELPAVARRDLGHQDVAALHHAAVRRRHRRIARTGAEQQEIVLGAECLGVPLEFERKLVLAHAGTRDLDEARIAEFGDAGGLARIGDLVHGLGGAPHRTRCRRRRGRAAASASGGRRCPSASNREAGDADPGAAQAAVPQRGCQRIDHIVGGDDAQRRAAFGRALGVPCRRHDQAGFAVARAGRRPRARAI